MQTAHPRIPIFCIVEIPPSTLDNLINETLTRHPTIASQPRKSENSFVLMTSKDVSTIHCGLSAPVQSFTSPFIGNTIEDVAAWFMEHIGEPERPGYMGRNFLILESEAATNGICTIVDLKERILQKLRCDFTLAFGAIRNLFSNELMSEAIMGSFSRSGLAMTKDNIDLAMHSGRYLDGMEVKIDPLWKDFGMC